MNKFHESREHDEAREQGLELRKRTSIENKIKPIIKKNINYKLN